MRTTVAIADEVLAEAKRVAARSDRTLGDVVTDALRVHLSALGSGRARQPVTLPRYGGYGLRPGVDLSDKDALAELLDGGGAGAAG